MSVNRIATSNQYAYLTSKLLNTQATVAKYTEETANNGQISTSYGDYGDKTMAMETARSMVERTTAYQTATKLASTQTKLQDNQLSSLSDLAKELKTAISDAISSGDGSSLVTTCADIFNSAASILNYQDSNGSYIYGGGNDSEKPFSVSSFTDLVNYSLDASDPSKPYAFTNGSTVKSVQVADNQTVAIGLAASDVGTSLMSTLKEVAKYLSDNSMTTFSASISTADNTFLTGEITSATTAYKNINEVSAKNGIAYQRLETASDTQTSTLTLYNGFVSGIQNENLTTIAAELANAQTSLQAAVQVTSMLNSVSLLKYID
jgi:flagellar hook-associated protein 3 FlgL